MQISYCIGGADEDLRFIFFRVHGNRFAPFDVFEILANGAALRGAELVDVEPAVKMIDFVEDGAAEESGGVELEFSALDRAGLDRDALGACDVEGEAGETEAAFVADDLGLGRLERRVDEDEGHEGL